MWRFSHCANSANSLLILAIIVHPRGPAVEAGRVAFHLLGDFQDFEGGQFASHRSYIQDRERPVQICPLPWARVKCPPNMDEIQRKLALIDEQLAPGGLRRRLVSTAPCFFLPSA